MNGKNDTRRCPFLEFEVIAMRESRASGEVTIERLSKVWGTTTGNMSAICRGDIYKNVGGPRTAPGPGPLKRLSPEQIAHLLMQVRRGDKYEYIADDFDVNDCTVAYHARKAGIPSRRTFASRAKDAA